MNTILWGAGGQAIVLRELFEEDGNLIVALFDNDPNARSPLSGVPVYHGVTGFKRWFDPRSAESIQGLAALGNRGTDRIHIHKLFTSHGIHIACAIHRTAFVANDALIGVGVQVMARASLCARAVVGDAALINTGASVDHECIIERGASVGPGAILTGRVAVEEFAFVGAGAVVLPRVRIGARSVVGAGAVVTKDVPPDTTVRGNPARADREFGSP
jgi:sugar O-acyltransferase (sialic acid O-acetyltransferase NeuD family)